MCLILMVRKLVMLVIFFCVFLLSFWDPRVGMCVRKTGESFPEHVLSCMCFSCISPSFVPISCIPPSILVYFEETKREQQRILISGGTQICVFILTDTANASRRGGKRCRCYERRRAKA